MERYYGKYCRFDAPSKKDAAMLLGSDNIVGDVFSIDPVIEDGEHRAWLVNRFDARVGYLGAADSKHMSLLHAQGLCCKAILSFVAFTDHPDDGHYWGEVGIVCYNPSFEDAFEPFIKGVARKIGEGVRPELDLGDSSVDQIIESEGAWLPSKSVPFPKTEKGTAILKRRRGALDSVVELGRSGNKGCYAISWIFLLALVALLVFGLHSCGLF